MIKVNYPEIEKNERQSQNYARGGGISTFWGSLLIFFIALFGSGAIYFIYFLSPTSKIEAPYSTILKDKQKNTGVLGTESEKKSTNKNSNTNSSASKIYKNDVYSFTLNYPKDFALTLGKTAVFESSDFSSIDELKGGKIELTFDSNPKGEKVADYWRIHQSGLKLSDKSSLDVSGHEAMTFKAVGKDYNAGALVDDGKIMFFFAGYFEKGREAEFFEILKNMVKSVEIK